MISSLIQKIMPNQNIHDSEHYLNQKKMEKKHQIEFQEKLRAAFRDETIVEPSLRAAQNPTEPTHSFDPHAQSIANFYGIDINTLMSAFKDSRNILDEVNIILLLCLNSTADTMQRDSNEMSSLVDVSNQLKEASDGLKEYSDWLQNQVKNSQTTQLDPSSLEDMPALLRALQDLGGYDPNSGSIQDAMTQMGKVLESDMVKINPNSKAAMSSLDSDIKKINASIDDSSAPSPSASVIDIMSQLNTSTNAATNINQVKMAALQGTTSNYQQLFGMITAFLQRMQDLNQKITSLT